MELNETGKIVIYQTKSGQAKLEVKISDDTIWLTQLQISYLFNVDRTVVTKHINNIFNTRELLKESNVQKMHIAKSDKPVSFYNLDVIISVGYRVNSIQGTQFRIWATNILRKHLVDGYTINKQRIKEVESKYLELQKTINMLASNIKTSSLVSEEAKGILQVIGRYSKALDILDRYDHQNLEAPKGKKKEIFKITYENAEEIIAVIQSEFKESSLVGREYKDSFKSVLKDIYQTFDGKELYSTVEEKAGNILYLITKNHCFVDGNKRIAASVFVLYLQNNNILFDKGGMRRIDDNALVALTLMIATSKPQEKDTIVKIISNLLI
ncbi:MAG: RhuM family protein [Endomicrobiaceae bacterium]|jgi:prophage maintenance system killer protein|nr:RhuM family protein [Endomicrobiaceae bacterium]